MLCQRRLIDCFVERLYWAVLAVALGFTIDGAHAVEPRWRQIDERAIFVPPTHDSVAADLVHAALVAELEGRDAERSSLLRQAVEAARDFPPAHWHAGRVLFDGQWLSLSAIAQRAPSAATIEQYRALARQARPTVKEQLTLADWCRDAGLSTKERMHLLHAHALKPGLPEVIQRLDLRRHEGQWLPAEVVERRLRAESATAAWDQLLAKTRGDLLSRDAVRRESALRQLTTIDDPTASQSLERIISGASSEAALACVGVLSRMPQQPASDALARLAVQSQWADARMAAAQALRPRSLYSYAPLLLDGLQAPIEVHVDARLRYGGAATHRLELFQEGPLADRSFVAAMHVRPEIGAGTSPSAQTAGGLLRTDGVDLVSTHSQAGSLPAALGSLDAAGRDAASIAQRVARFNSAARQRNERIAVALATATGQQVSAEPRLVWKWWCDYNELYVPEHKPVYERATEHVVKYSTSISSTGRHAASGAQANGTTVQLPTISCFLAGTKVWTPQGPRAIEAIQMGDDVLSQDVETGELAFKPVLATTVRPASPILTMDLGGEAFGVTRGHPLWVVGAGWQMAKELSCGQRLHAVDGAAVIERIDKSPDAESFNLVVADFHTYFVGDRKVLVHDNNIREATSAPLPGWPQSSSRPRTGPR